MSRLSKIMLEVSPYKELELKYKHLEQQLQQAHKRGWEQAKRAAKLLSFSCSCHKAIASMEYKMEANDESV